MFDNTAAELADVEGAVRKRHICNCLKAVPAYGEGVAKALVVAMDTID